MCVFVCFLLSVFSLEMKIMENNMENNSDAKNKLQQRPLTCFFFTFFKKFIRGKTGCRLGTTFNEELVILENIHF